MGMIISSSFNVSFGKPFATFNSTSLYESPRWIIDTIDFTSFRLSYFVKFPGRIHLGYAPFTFIRSFSF
jgi:hypothetical protein